MPGREVEPSRDESGAKVVRFLMQRGVDGFGPFKSAQDSAREALVGRTPEEAVRHLIRNHCVIAGGQGFVTGLGGILATAIALPANLGASYLVQVHLAASIACVYGHDENSEDVRTAIVACLVGNAGTEVVKRVGMRAGRKKASVALARRVPLVGGIVGGGVDLAATRAVGHFADRYFRPGAQRSGG
ncbi:MAG: EcsC family protein [Sporichthyaceae bacterium]